MYCVLLSLIYQYIIVYDSWCHLNLEIYQPSPPIPSPLPPGQSPHRFQRLFSWICSLTVSTWYNQHHHHQPPQPLKKQFWVAEHQFVVVACGRHCEMWMHQMHWKSQLKCPSYSAQLWLYSAQLFLYSAQLCFYSSQLCFYSVLCAQLLDYYLLNTNLKHSTLLNFVCFCF